MKNKNLRFIHELLKKEQLKRDLQLREAEAFRADVLNNPESHKPWEDNESLTAVEYATKKFAQAEEALLEFEDTDWLPFLTDGKGYAGQEEKQAWLREIGAKEFPGPVSYVYTFPGYSGAFNLSEDYVRRTPLEKMKEMYGLNKIHVEQIIASQEKR